MAGLKFPRRYFIVFLTFICTNVCYIERVGFSIAYTAAADAVGVSQSSKGLILSAFFYGYAVSQVPGGWAAQLIGGRRVLLMSFLLWSLTCALFPLDPARATLLASARLLMALHRASSSLQSTPYWHSGCLPMSAPAQSPHHVRHVPCAAAGMLVLPSLVKLRGPQSVFMAEASLGFLWSLLWYRFSTDPSTLDTLKASSAGFLPLSKLKDDSSRRQAAVPPASSVGIPWGKIFLSPAIWAIVVNNFTFHYALYVLMNWLPTYFEQGLEVSLQEMGSSKMLPYLNILLFCLAGLPGPGEGGLRCEPSGRRSEVCGHCHGSVQHGWHTGWDYWRRPHREHPGGGEGGSATGDLSTAAAWRPVFFVPGYLCLFSAAFFLVFSTGERIFD
ncbi:unnamed protein product [Spirodela intermedia]|uniref:Uncharacterized protein n=1 Tax=Spirodela intermedia TaxID=51605 RepID=A0A7I8INI3_SPIIN|nr:unnamed protein product [Spirodela intermedia]CAA6658547.1 unnamed protein product [Spirodela intermedia]